jgi:hypothetical protein
MDDNPRTEFTPRERHKLKEFAVSVFLADEAADLWIRAQAIVMREMELWRDKVCAFSRLHVPLNPNLHIDSTPNPRADPEFSKSLNPVSRALILNSRFRWKSLRANAWKSTQKRRTVGLLLF